jgi:hypothetical protein
LNPLPHQLQKAEECFNILKEKNIVYLAGKPRSGKTYTAILTVEKIEQPLRVIVLTKKNAIEGWHKFIDDNESLHHSYTVTNYEQAGKLKPEYDISIIDEAHNLKSFPKVTQRLRTIRAITLNIPAILLSGTALTESPCGIFHQCYVTKFTPFQHRNFYAFHREFGTPYSKFINGREMRFYDRYKPELMNAINSFTVYMTQEDAGISSELQAVDKIHYVNLLDETKKLYNDFQKNRIVEIHGRQLVGDSIMKLRTSLHMIESGIVKIEDDYISIGNTEKIDYIKSTFGDNENVGIMSHFVGERELLKKYFQHAQIYSSNASAEGVDLSHLEHFVIISSDYSGAKFIQRRERIVNVNGSNTLTVNHILVRNAISDQVYSAVSKKMDFNNQCYRGAAL